MLKEKEEQLLPFAERALIFPMGYGWGESPSTNEFAYLKQRVKGLYRLNMLHRKLSGLLHLTGLIEGFSLWLEHYLPHLAFGYYQENKECRHFYCHSHGEERRKVIAAVREIGGRAPGVTCLPDNGYLQYIWEAKNTDEAGSLFLICRGRLTEKSLELISDALEVLLGNLPRVLAYEKIHFQATRDTLTGLANRRTFHERGQELISAARSHHYPLALLVLDLDNFKAVNDNLGHLQGDDVLVKVAGILQDTVRATDLAARIGGDEFVVLLDNTDLQGAKIFADRLCRAVDHLAIQPAASVRLGVSIGLSQYDEKEDLFYWMKRTDALLYRAKAKGKAQVAAEER